MPEKPILNFYSIENNQNNYFQRNASSGRVEELKSLERLSNVNLFIGANNSGKSRFIRGLFFPKKEKPSEVGNKFKWSITNKIYKDESNHLSKLPEAQNINNLGSEYYGTNANRHTFYKDHIANITGQKKVLYIPILRGFPHYEIHQCAKKNTNFDIWADQGTIPSVLKDLREWTKSGFFSNADLYKNYIQDTYKMGIHINIYSGYGMYEAIKKKLLGNESGRLEIKKFQDFLKNNFFDGKDVLLTPNEEKGVLFVDVEDTFANKAIYDLGDGVQNLITIFFKVFFEDNCVFLIEEPENTLHPSMQRKMIAIFYSDEIQKKGHQFFISTHSNHLMDLTLDYENISIYKFTSLSGDKKLVEQVDSGDESVLFELGVNNSSVFIANSTIWVEGITDRMYLKKILELYLQNKKITNLKEDVDYAFIEYGGGNVIHFNFTEEMGEESIYLKRIAGKSLLIADTDWTENLEKYSIKRERIKNFKKSLGKRFLPIKGEIENILSSKNIFDGIKAFPIKSKEITTHVEIQNIEFKPIGKLIDNTYFKGKKSFAKSKQNGSLGVDKKNFAKGVIENMTYENLSKNAKNIAEKIYKHIEEQRREIRSL